MKHLQIESGETDSAIFDSGSISEYTIDLDLFLFVVAFLRKFPARINEKIISARFKPGVGTNFLVEFGYSNTEEGSFRSIFSYDQAEVSRIGLPALEARARETIANTK